MKILARLHDIERQQYKETDIEWYLVHQVWGSYSSLRLGALVHPVTSVPSV